MAYTIQLRRDTAANWTSVNPVLHQGEAGVETDTGQSKIGDGTSAWTGLGYWAGGGRSVFNVRSFGAKGNGVADDTTAIQNAITAATAAGGVTYFPKGTYVITSTLSFGSGAALIGDGRGSTTLLASGIAGAAILNATVSVISGVLTNVLVADMTIDGATGPTGTATGIWFDTHLFSQIDYHNVVFERLQFQNLHTGWVFSAVQGGAALTKDSVTVHACRFINCAAGIILGGTYAVLISSSVFVGNTACAIGTSGYQGVPSTGVTNGDVALTTITGCVIQGLGNLTGGGTATESGIIFSGTDTIISNCQFDWISRYPIWLQSNEGGGTNISSLNICQTGGSILRLDNDQTAYASGIVTNVFASFAVQNPALNSGAAISIEGGSWDLSDITFSAGGSSGGGFPAAVYALRLGWFHPVHRLTVTRYYCQQFSLSWLAAIPQTNPALDLVIKECPGYNPLGTQAVNALSADDSSFEGGTGTFIAGGPSTIATSTAQALYGSHSLAVTGTGTAIMWGATANNIYPALPGQLWTAFASYRAATTSRDCWTQISFNNSGGAQISFIWSGTQYNDLTSAWGQSWVSGVAPAGTAYVQVLATIGRLQGTAVGEVHYLDGIGLYRGGLAEAWGIGGLTTGSVPASGSPTAAAFTDRIYYVTAASSGTTTAATAVGPTITIPASACVPVTVPAGQTITPAYSTAPTWVVEGL